MSTPPTDPDTIRAWMKANRTGYRSAAAEFGMTPEEVKVLCSSRAPTRTRTRVEKLEKRLKSVSADMNLCREATKVTALSALQGLAHRIEREITDLEEAADLEKARANLTAGQGEIVDSLIAELLIMPPAIIETVVARLIGRHEAAEA